MSNRKHEVPTPQLSQPIFIDQPPQAVLANVPMK